MGEGGTIEALTPEQEAAINSEAMTKFKVLYQKTLKPLEQRYAFAQFMDLEPMLDEELDAKPMVMLLGQYSTGKTSLVRRLVGGNFPGMRMGPEPTTDKFTAVLHTDGEDDTISGATLSMTPAQPFAGLRRFGPAFLNSFSGALTDSDFLSRINIVDTPGVLSGASLRDYGLQAVCRWFAVRADLILLLFDGNKLEVSDEFRKIIRDLWGHEEKVRLILNKCDLLSSDDLMKVYGALMWAMGKCLKSTPEVPRIYTTAFGSEADVEAALKGGAHLDGEAGDASDEGEDQGGMAMKTPRKDGKSDDDGFNRRMRQDMRDLMKEVTMCDGMTCTRRKLDDLVKRLRLLVVHMFILAELRDEIKKTWWWRRPAKKAELLEKFDKVLVTATAKFYLAEGDLPAENAIMQRLADVADWTKLPRPREKDFATLQKLLDTDIPDLQGLLSGQGAAALLEKQKQPTFMQYMSKEALKPRRKTHWAIFISILVVVLAAVVAVATGTAGAPMNAISGFHPMNDVILPAQTYASSTVVKAQQAMEATVNQLSEDTSKLWSSVAGGSRNASPETTEPAAPPKPEPAEPAVTRTASDIPDAPSAEL